MKKLIQTIFLLLIAILFLSNCDNKLEESEDNALLVFWEKNNCTEKESIEQCYREIVEMFLTEKGAYLIDFDKPFFENQNLENLLALFFVENTVCQMVKGEMLDHDRLYFTESYLDYLTNLTKQSDYDWLGTYVEKYKIFHEITFSAHNSLIDTFKGLDLNNEDSKFILLMHLIHYSRNKKKEFRNHR